MPQHPKVDQDHERFRERVDRLHRVFAPDDDALTQWFADQVGRSHGWDDGILNGRKDIPLYAARVVEALEREADVLQASDPIGEERRDRTERFLEDLTRVREGLQTGAANLIAVIETVEELLAGLSKAKQRIRHATGNLTERIEATERVLEKEIRPEPGSNWGERAENEAEAEEIGRERRSA